MRMDTESEVSKTPDGPSIPLDDPNDFPPLEPVSIPNNKKRSSPSVTSPHQSWSHLSYTEKDIMVESIISNLNHSYTLLSKDGEILTEFNKSLIELMENSNKIWADSEPDITGRITALENTAAVLKEPIIKLDHFLDEIRNGMMILFLENIYPFELQSKKVDPEVLKLYTAFKEAEDYEKYKYTYKQRPPNPFQQLQRSIQNQKLTVGIIQFASLLHKLSHSKLLELIHVEVIRYLPFFDMMNSVGPVFWPIVNSILLTLHNVNTTIRNHKNIIFTEQEAQLLQSKIEHAKQSVLSHMKDFTVKPVPEQSDLDLLLLSDKLDILYRGPANLEYMTPQDLLKDAFSNIIKTCYHILYIEGDGNCFYRAITRHYFPVISKEREDELSLILRVKLNDDIESQKPVSNNQQQVDESVQNNNQENQPVESKQTEQTEPQKHYGAYNGFIEENVNDPSTMKKAGVWADHVQVQNMSKFLQSRLLLVRHDDIMLDIAENGLITPGPDYTITPEQLLDQAQDIVLHYIPTPGHYETLFQKKTPTETLVALFDLNEKLAEFYDKINGLLSQRSKSSDGTYTSFDVKPSQVIGILFALEEECQKVKNMYSTMYHYDMEYTNILKLEIKQLIDAIHSQIAGFKGGLDSLGKNYFNEYYAQPKADNMEHLLNKILFAIFDDDLLIVDGTIEHIAQGPLSDMCNLLKSNTPYIPDSSLKPQTPSVWSSSPPFGHSNIQ